MGLLSSLLRSSLLRLRACGRTPLLLLVVVAGIGAAPALLHTPAGAGNDRPVLAVDFVRTFPGEQADYLRFIELNWAAARRAAQEEGFVVGYEVIARAPADGDWDVMLVTEYAGAEAYTQREEHFTELFEWPELAMKPIDGKRPRDMAEVVAGGVEARRVLASNP